MTRKLSIIAFSLLVSIGASAEGILDCNSLLFPGEVLEMTDQDYGQMSLETLREIHAFPTGSNRKYKMPFYLGKLHKFMELRLKEMGVEFEIVKGLVFKSFEIKPLETGHPFNQLAYWYEKNHKGRILYSSYAQAMHFTGDTQAYYSPSKNAVFLDIFENDNRIPSLHEMIHGIVDNERSHSLFRVSFKSRRGFVERRHNYNHYFAYSEILTHTSDYRRETRNQIERHLKYDSYKNADVDRLTDTMRELDVKTVLEDLEKVLSFLKSARHMLQTSTEQKPEHLIYFRLKFRNRDFSAIVHKLVNHRKEAVNIEIPAPSRFQGRDLKFGVIDYEILQEDEKEMYQEIIGEKVERLKSITDQAIEKLEKHIESLDPEVAKATTEAHRELLLSNLSFYTAFMQFFSEHEELWQAYLATKLSQDKK